MAAVIKDNDSAEDHIYDTISGSDWLADQDAVEMFVEEAPRELIQLEHWGCPWSREATGHVAVRPFGGMKLQRTWFATDKTGFHVLHSLFQTCLAVRVHHPLRRVVRDEAAGGRRSVPGLHSHRAAHRSTAAHLRQGGDHRDGRLRAHLPLHHQRRHQDRRRPGPSPTSAGVALKDMEFVQYHPTGLPGTASSSPRRRGGKAACSGTTRASGIWPTTTWASRCRWTIRGIRSCGPWSSARATGCHRRSSRSRRRGTPTPGRTATTCTSTSSTWASTASTPSSPSCASWRGTTAASTPSKSRFPCGPWCTT